MEKNHLKVKLLGTTFAIQSAESPEQLEAILDYYKTRVEEINRKSVIADPLKLAIIAGLNIVDELFKERKQQDPLSRGPAGNSLELDKITERMINKINSSLQDHV